MGLTVRLLIVEDEIRMAALLKRGFEEEGYAVEVAGNGTDALWSATENEYDAVILDVMLPGLGGIEVCRRLRERNRWAPVIMVTARDAVIDRVDGLDAGADDYLVKPFSFAELAARVRALVRRGTHERPRLLEVGTLRLDPLRRQVWRDGTEVALTRREFALLELLMRRCGEVLTRTVILEHVWDFAYDPGSNVVDQYIAYLRAKVDRAFGRHDIETLRGVGYRLRPPEG
jgi:two-component system OmpR family response regulator